MSAVAMFWIGCTNAAREIVGERSVYLRERMVNLRVGPYVGSKVLVLGAACVVQTLLALALVKGMSGLDGDAWRYGVTMLAAALSGLGLGLLISALAQTPSHADAIVQIVVIPQIVFACVIEPVEDMNLPSRVVSYAVSTRWTNEALSTVFREVGYADMWRTNGLVLAFGVALVLGTVALLRYRKDSI